MRPLYFQSIHCIEISLYRNSIKPRGKYTISGFIKNSNSAISSTKIFQIYFRNMMLSDWIIVFADLITPPFTLA